jgi:RNA polymerase sigma factor for flagellar operon FliA
MADRGDLEALFLAHRVVLARLATAVGRRQGMRGDDLDDFVAWVAARVIEQDYAVLARFRGESSLPTYLAVVAATLGREYRVRHWGRWRPSAAARRLGPVAERLEMLVHRDGLRLGEAAEALRTAGLTALPDGALAAMLAACPARLPARPVVAADAAHDADAVPDADARADARLLDAEADADRHALGTRLAEAVDQLPGEDRVMVRLRFWQGLSVADVARALAVPQKPLYRRLERVLAGLRAELERRGVDREAVQALLDEARPPAADERVPADDGTPRRPEHPPRLGDARPPPGGDFAGAQPST